MVKKKILLSSGCSYTDRWGERKIGNYWPAYLANKLDMDYVNVAKSGGGNDYILKSITEFITKNPLEEIGLVCCLWSDYTREYFYWPEWQFNMSEAVWNGHLLELDPKIYNNLKYNLDTGPSKKLEDGERERQYSMAHMLDIMDKLFKHELTHMAELPNKILKNIIIENFLRFYQLECICKSKNIPYVYWQGIDIFAHQGQRDVETSIKKEYEWILNLIAPKYSELNYHILKLESYFDKEKFIGWPTVNTLGGYTYSDISDDRKYWIGDKYGSYENDRHPNEEGHKLIAEEFYKKVEELYPKLISKNE